MVFESSAERARVIVKLPAVEGLAQTLDRIGEHVAKPQR
jgi:hypothetical protein